MNAAKTNATEPALSTMRETHLDAFCVYTFVHDEGQRDDWLKIGIAVPHVDGNGFSITLQALPFEGRLILRKRHVQQEQSGEIVPLAQQVEAFERAVIERCLRDSGGRINVVMQRLGLPRRTLNEKMSRLGVERHRESKFSPATAERPMKIGQK